MEKKPFALKTPFPLHGFLYVLAAHLSAYLSADVFFILCPADWVHTTYISALVVCVLSLPLFLWWFVRNENPIGYLAVTAASQLACGTAGAALVFPMIALAKALISDPEKLDPWAFLAVWVGVAVFFGALLLILCAGLLIHALIRRKRAPKSPERSQDHDQS